MGNQRKPLEGIRVIELANYVAAPIVGRMCADLGAEVIKLEGRGGGEMINVSHFLGVFHGRHRIVGNMDTPPRKLFDYAQKHMLDKLPLTFVLTVMDQENGEEIYFVRNAALGLWQYDAEQGGTK